MTDINEILKSFGEFETDTQVQLRKAECAKQISEALRKLSGRVEEVVENLLCEAAVVEAQYIIDN